MIKIKKKIKRIIKKFFQSSYFLKNVESKIQEWRKKRYYKKYCLPLPIDNHLILFESFLGKQYACSPKAIYEAMKKDSRYDDYRFVWAFRNADEKRKIMADKRTIIVKYGSRKYFRMYARAKYWVSNWRISEAIQKKDEQIFVQTWHGTPLKKIGMDLKIEGNATTSQKAGHKKYLSDAEKYDYFISPSKFCTDVFRSAFGLSILGKDNIIIEEGYPRNDFLYQYQESDVNTIKQKLGIDKDKKVILYAPTWRDNQHQLGVGYTSNSFDYIKKMIDTISDEYVILLRLHYLVASKLNLEGYENKVIDCSKLDDVNYLYVISDILITDYSSVFFDYSNLKRPILFYMYDLEEYENGIRDFYIDLSELPGPIIKTEEELIQSVKNIDAISEAYSDKYIAFNQKYTYLDDANASIRVVEKFIEKSKLLKEHSCNSLKAPIE